MHFSIVIGSSIGSACPDPNQILCSAGGCSGYSMPISWHPPYMPILSHYHHILSHQYVIQAWAVPMQSLRSRSVQSVQWGPSVHSERIWSIICLGWPQGHSLFDASPHLCRLLAVFPTLALALLSVITQLFCGRSVPVGSCSLGAWVA